MRSSWLLAAVVAWAGSGLGLGCQWRQHSGSRYTLVVDAADIAATTPAGQPWCATGTLTTVVGARFNGVRTATDPAPGLVPEWRTPLIEATADDFARGVGLDVTGSCGGTSVSIALGELAIRPRASRIHDGAVIIAAFGSTVRLRLHFRLTEGPAFDDGSWIDDGGWPDCIDLDCGRVDDGSWVDDGAWTDDSGWTDDGGWHDEGSGGSSDDGGSADDDGGDYMDDGGGSDDGGGGSDGEGLLFLTFQ